MTSQTKTTTGILADAVAVGGPDQKDHTHPTTEALKAEWLAASRRAWELSQAKAGWDAWRAADLAAYIAYRRYAAAVMGEPAPDETAITAHYERTAA